jgi:hypothetical protein
MDWTYFASKRFQVAAFQREASTTPVVVPMSKPMAIAVSANRGAETGVTEIKRLLSQANQGGSTSPASHMAMRFHTRCWKSGGNSPSIRQAASFSRSSESDRSSFTLNYTPHSDQTLRKFSKSLAFAGLEYELRHETRGMPKGAFDAQGLGPIPQTELERRVGQRGKLKPV